MLIQAACPVSLDARYIHNSCEMAVLESSTVQIDDTSPLSAVSCTECHLFGLVVMGSASRASDPVFESRLRLDFSGSSHTSDVNKNDTSGAWRCRIRAGTGWTGVNIL